MKDKEIYFSVDIETNGPIPGENSMLSFGSAAFTSDDFELVGTFTANLRILFNSKADPDTMKWWESQPEAYAACRKDLQDPGLAIVNFINHVKDICNKYGGKPVFIAYPAGFDFLFMYWYMIKFAGESPFSFSALDIKSYAMAMLKKGYRKSTKRYMPKRWFSTTQHSHEALQDAIEQGELFINMLKENISGEVD